MLDDETSDALRAGGFVVRHRERVRLSYPAAMSYVTDLWSDPLSHLADSPPVFTFARFPDEMVDVESSRVSGEIFGQTGNYGPLLRAHEGSIHLLAIKNDGPEVFGAEVVFVNSDSSSFLRCYSLFAEIRFEVRMHFDELDETGARLADEFSARVADIDPPSVAEGLFWGQYAFLLEEIGLSDLPLRTVTLANLTETGRIAI